MSEAITDASSPTNPIGDPGTYSFDADAGDFRNVLYDVASQDQATGKDRHDDAPQMPDPSHGTGGNGPGPAAAPAAPGGSAAHRGACAVVGGVAGAVIGGGIGAVGEGLAGAGIGTLALPGGGTFVGGAAGAADGAKNGAIAGGIIGAGVGASICGGDSTPAQHVASTANSDGTQGSQRGQNSAKPGKLTGSLDGLSPAEKDYAREQLAAGHDVEVVPTGPGRTPDFRIDGRPVELKTLSGVQNRSPDGLSSALSSRIMDGRGQSGNVVVDARSQPGMTRDIAQRGIARALGSDKTAGDKIQTITVLTPEGTVSYKR